MNTWQHVRIVLFNQLCVQPSVCMIFTRVSFPLPSLFFLHVSSTHAQLRSLYPPSTFGAFHMTKNTRLSMSAQLQCSRSGAWEPGNEATTYLVWYMITAMVSYSCIPQWSFYVLGWCCSNVHTPLYSCVEESQSWAELCLGGGKVIVHNVLHTHTSIQDMGEGLIR